MKYWSPISSWIMINWESLQKVFHHGCMMMWTFSSYFAVLVFGSLGSHEGSETQPRKHIPRTSSKASSRLPDLAQQQHYTLVNHATCKILYTTCVHKVVYITCDFSFMNTFCIKGVNACGHKMFPLVLEVIKIVLWPLETREKYFMTTGITSY